MQVTIFSFLMAVIWGSFIVLIQYAFIKKRYFVTMFGISSILLLYIFSLARMLIPVELSFTKVVDNVPFWNWLYEFFSREKVRFMGETFTRDYLLLQVWLGGSILLGVRFIVKYMKATSAIQNLKAIYSVQAIDILKKVSDAIGKEFNVRVLISPSVECPIGIGVFKKTILLPTQNYSDDEMYYILLHEVTHFMNKDIPFKILIQLFCCIFWWNPIVYLLRKDLNQILEIKCDLNVVKNMDKKRKISYLSTIVHVIKAQGDRFKINGLETVSIVGANKEAELVERFKIISDDKISMRGGSKKTIWYLGVICVMLASYSFVIQSTYQPPEDEIVTEEGTLDISPETSYITVQENGNYLLIHESGYEEVIDKEWAEELITEGFTLERGE